jgi:NAD+ synthase
LDKDQRIRALVGWIQERVLGAGRRGVVLGLSGGVDSTLLAVLCKRAFPKNTVGLIMPCYSLPEDKDTAENISRQFEIPTKTITLNGIYDAMLNVLPIFSSETSVDRIAKANIKTRLRMVTLYYTANQMNYLVAGSGNRDEVTIGYFTKYGDGGVDILPLGNLVKKEVKELARFVGIAPEIVDKPPSAGLWPGQLDETEIGFSYEMLDRFLQTGTAPEALKSRIEYMIAACRHKKAAPAIPEF